MSKKDQKNQPKEGLIFFTYAFLFLLGCKASFHRWLERLNTHLIVRWFRFSVAFALSLLAISLVPTFNGSMTSESGKLTLLGALLKSLHRLGSGRLSVDVVPAQ